MKRYLLFPTNNIWPGRCGDCGDEACCVLTGPVDGAVAAADDDKPW